ncbi:hypothetical protein [Achromobacter sp. Root83]|uniref:hypothetical protein n=1 Tax=Achromobacter sp. Root83 TaxID=1736602 RepID=UPI0012E3BAA7|nr:hypothetical protein [Achromobacter sp. Root83]
MADCMPFSLLWDVGENAVGSIFRKLEPAAMFVVPEYFKMLPITLIFFCPENSRFYGSLPLIDKMHISIPYKNIWGGVGLEIAPSKK